MCLYFLRYEVIANFICDVSFVVESWVSPGVCVDERVF